MSLSKSKCWDLNNGLHFLKFAVPLSLVIPALLTSIWLIRRSLPEKYPQAINLPPQSLAKKLL